MADQNSIRGIVAVEDDSKESRAYSKQARQELDSKFVRDGDTYRPKDYPHSVAFTDHGDKITTHSDSKEYAAGMVTLARTRNWDVSEVRGTDNFYNNVNEHIKDLERNGSYDAKGSRELVAEYKRYGAEAVEARVFGEKNKEKANQAIAERVEPDRFRLQNITDRDREYNNRKQEKQQEQERGR